MLVINPSFVLIRHSVYSLSTLTLSLVLYSETGKYSEKIAENAMLKLKQINSVFIQNMAILSEKFERNLIEADFDDSLVKR